MKRLAAFILTLAIFATPVAALADCDQRSLSQIFDRYEETILYGE